jgi:hypothetical protein
MKTALPIGTLALASTLMACAASSSPTGIRAGSLRADGEGTELVTVRLVDAMISPTRLDGRPWDVAVQLEGSGARDRVVSAMNHAANAKGAYDAAASVLGHVADGSSGLPDVRVKASVDTGDGKAQASSFDGETDSLTPHFRARWEHVVLTRWTMVHMYFVDADEAGASDIGAVVLSPLDLAAALEEKGKVHHLRVDDQTNGQILFVGIAVDPER